MSGRSRVRRVEVSPVRRPEPGVSRVVEILVRLAVQLERAEMENAATLAQASRSDEPSERGGASGSVERAA